MRIHEQEELSGVIAYETSGRVVVRSWSIEFAHQVVPLPGFVAETMMIDDPAGEWGVEPIATQVVYTESQLSSIDYHIDHPTL